MFSNLFSSIKSGVGKALDKGKSILSNVGSTLSSGVKGLSASVINAVSPSSKTTTSSGPYSNIVGVDPKTGKPNMTVMPNQTLSSGQQGYTSPQTGKTSVLNSLGQTQLIPTLRLQSGALSSSGKSVPNTVQELNDIIQSGYRSSTADSYGRYSTPEFGSTYSIKGADGKSITITPKAGFSGLSGTSAQPAFDFNNFVANARNGSNSSMFGQTGLSGAAGGSASTGLLTGTSGLNTPSLPGQTGTDEDPNIADKKKAPAQIFPPEMAQLFQQLTGQPLQTSAFQLPPFQVETPGNVINSSALGKTNPMLNANLSSLPDLQGQIAQGFTEQRQVIDQIAPLPQAPIADTIGQADFINQSQDPFGVKQALDDFRTQNTNLGDLQKQRIDILKDVQALNATYRPIFDSIKNNPNLPKALAMRRLEAVNKSHKEILQGFLDQHELINQSITDQNEIVNRAFNIVELAESKEEKAKNRLASQLNLFVSSGAIGGFTDADINTYAQALGLPPKTLVAMRDAANQPKVDIKGSVEEGFVQFTTDKSGNVTTKKLTGGAPKATSPNVISTMSNNNNPTIKWLGQAATNLSNSIYSSAQRENFLENVGNAVASGDLEFARQQVRTFAYEKLGTAAKQDFDLNANGASIADVAVDLIAQNKVDFGPYKTLGEFLKPTAKQSKDQNYVQARQAIELAQAQIRKGYYGTAVTATEAGNANQFLVNDFDDAKTVATKLRGYSQFLEWANDVTIARKLGVQQPDVRDYISNVNTSPQSPTGTGTVLNTGKTSSGVGYKIIQR